MNIEPVEVIMWADMENKAHATIDAARLSNVEILERREYRRKEQIVKKRIGTPFNDWLRFANKNGAEKIWYMNKGAEEMMEYCLKHDFFKDKLFEEEL